MSPKANAVAQRLEDAWQRWWLYSLLAGGALAAGASAGVLLLFVALDVVLQLPQAALLALFLTWASLTLGLGVALLVRSRRGRRSLAAAARRVEMEFPELGSHLINLVQLPQGGTGTVAAFRKAAVEQAAAAAGNVPFEQAGARETRWRRFLLALQTPRDFAEAFTLLTALLALGAVLVLLTPRWASAVNRVLHPWAFVPSVGSVKIVEVIPGDTDVPAGVSVEVVARIDNPDHKAHPATLYVRREGEAETAQAMTADEANEQFVAALPHVLAPLRYRLQIGDSQTRLYAVGVRPMPVVEEVQIAYSFPAYIDRPKQTVTQKHGDLDGPQFAMADLTIRSSTPLSGGYLLVDGQRVDGWLEEDGRALGSYLFLQRSTTYTIHLISDAGQANPEPRLNQVKVTPDLPPAVQLLEPGREGQAAAGGKLAVVVRAGDDYGLGAVRVEMKPAEESAAETVVSWDKFANPTSAVLRHELALDPARFKPGQTLFVRALAADRRKFDIDGRGLKLALRPQETSTPWHAVRLITPEAKAAEELAQLDALRAALGKILEQQVKARVTAAEVPKRKAPAEATRLAGAVRAGQVEVQLATVAVVQSIGKADTEERLVIKRAANKLAFGDMLEAVKQAEALAKPEAAGPSKPAAALNVTQDRIIDVLQRLLNEVRRETADAMTQTDRKPSNELPPDVKSKLAKLDDKLKELVKQQKKVIEATQALAKVPVEDFTEKEKQLLKDLAATEDDWSRFLADLHSDLSKLPEQDFSNPSLLQEMVEVQTQLKMAEDALTKKSADIAVPLEQLGAEMAKELSTNIEKWLPDTPDRERWSQEEPLTDDMKAAPMAELPGELEDIIGDLMEQEEDLFDEMEDVSSSWADSIDKGAGWDAMDGPISNNSAKGVTGNRLPNTSEVAGRSGEGRSGKSSGEFVGDSAVGKGGRKTPTRLTPDAHVKGQVKDHSKDPSGGATGGGKESGAGGEGLQGPVPDRPERMMERLATRQAELRNKAESVDLQFQVHNYHHTDLRKMIDTMSGVENDLRAGRYHNALRRREVLLDGLGQVKTYVKGEFSVRQDKTVNLPTDIQKEILGTMQEASPAGWEGLNRQYFERLAAPGPAPVETNKDKK
ncbi:MAG TPA: hypothetical protein VKA46_09545 [Gemmataceae bacterium]|nr:hypothetical protein [Gemmataceae bacterium]